MIQVSTQIRITSAIEKLVNSRKTTRGKFTLRVELSSPITINADDETAMKMLAETITKDFQESMLAGNVPGGGPLPAAAPTTVVRRDDRLKQAQRSGAPAPRYKGRGKKNAYPKAKQNYRKRFRSPKLGLIAPGQHPVPAGTVGLESGMLARSALATVEKVGGGVTRFRVFFANPRALVDKHGSSAVDRVFRLLGSRRVWISDKAWARFKQDVGKILIVTKRLQFAVNELTRLTETRWSGEDEDGGE